MTNPFWRPLTTIDLPAVQAIAATVHPGFFESPDIFAERLRLYPGGAHLLEFDGEPRGYIFAHPWRAGTVPMLNSLLGAIPEGADSYYLHDLALLPSARGTGAATQIVGQQIALAASEGFRSASLVAVNGSAGFWQRLGFAPDHRPELDNKLRSYEPSACYMVRLVA